MVDDKNPRSGVPQGFGENVNIRSSEQMRFENVEDPNKMTNIIKIAILSGIAFILLIFVIVYLVYLNKMNDAVKYSSNDLVDSYVEILDGKDVETFDSFIYKKATNEDDVRKFIKSGQDVFSDKKIFTNMTKIEKKPIDQETKGNILSILGKKAKSPTSISFDVYYSSDKESDSPTETINFVFYIAEIKGSTYFAYGNSGEITILGDTEKEEEIATPGDSVATATDADASYNIVGNEDIGMINVPGNYGITNFDLKVDGISAKYVYGNANGTGYVMLLKYGEKTGELKERVSALASALIPSYEIKEGEAVGKEAGTYYGYGESGNSVVEIYSFNGKEDKDTRAVVLVYSKDESLAGLLDSYVFSQGVSTETVDAVPEGMKRVGNDNLGYLIIGEDFEDDEEYTYDNSLGWTRGEETIVLVTYFDTPQANLPTMEFAEIMRTNYLGEESEELQTGDWFPGAAFSKRVEEGKITEIYAFKGKDDVNRLILIYSPAPESEVSSYYSSYNLPIGVVEEIGE